MTGSGGLDGVRQARVVARGRTLRGRVSAVPPWPIAAAVERYNGRPPSTNTQEREKLLSNPMLPLALVVGTLYGGLAAAGAYVISYDEYRRRWLSPGQNARRMAMCTAAVMFAFFFLGAVVLAFVLRPAGS